MRLPYTPDPPAPSTPQSDLDVIARIRDRRAPRPLQPLDRTLLHAPPIADGWNSFLGAVRTQSTLPADVRELAISRVAVVNRAWYEWGHHASLAVAAGVSQAAMDAVKAASGALKLADKVSHDLDDRQWAVLVLTDEMTRNVTVSDETFDAVKKAWSEREVVEIVATVSCYNCVSRFLVALDVGERNATGPDHVVKH
ncbi:carboxymuconolactone decarboxylase [Coniella lustricola]|uniref:Carboxymuconolactone decarboxylase n=1 Tax=Coniella lustricola TaxID=2025994 RepID=A0A2T3ACS7_9PEZI|nr:carboxymuconolactone decarboxylase [Coniella lustricola]